MGAARSPGAESRRPLSRERILRAAVELADREGLAALTMRNLAAHLGVEAMSLYHHVRNKDALLDGVADVIVDEINTAVADLDAPAPGNDWRAAVRARILAARGVLLAHDWAPSVLASRTAVSPAVLRYFDGLLGQLRAGGFSWDVSHHALHALGSRALGFAQELFAPADLAVDEQVTRDALAALTAEVPHLVGMLAAVSHDDPATTLGWCDDQAEFEFGLDVLLDGLENRRVAG